jgi:hypothetical protein
VWVLQPRDQLGLGLEAPDELGVIGIFREDDFDGNLAADQRLGGAIDGAKAARADTRAQLLTLDHLAA